jgi:hypothetical protein
MCMVCYSQPEFLDLKEGQKVRIKAGVGSPRLKRVTVVTIYKISGHSMITTTGSAFMASEFDHMTPLQEFVQNPQLEDALAKRRYARFFNRKRYMRFN